MPHLQHPANPPSQADGRILSVYAKVGNTPSVQTPTRASSDNDMVVDGSYGFDDPTETGPSTTKQPPTGPAAGVGGSGLYSDNLVKGGRWGRGFSGAARSGRR